MARLDQGPELGEKFHGRGVESIHGFQLGRRGGFRDSEPGMGSPVSGRPGEEVDAPIIFLAILGPIRSSSRCRRGWLASFVRPQWLSPLNVNRSIRETHHVE